MKKNTAVSSKKDLTTDERLTQALGLELRKEMARKASFPNLHEVITRRRHTLSRFCSDCGVRNEETVREVISEWLGKGYFVSDELALALLNFADSHGPSTSTPIEEPPVVAETTMGWATVIEEGEEEEKPPVSSPKKSPAKK